MYCQKCPPLPGVYRWSLRDAQRYFTEHPECVGASISRATIQRILAEHVLKPHRRKYYLQITDPDFFPKMEHIIGCYLNPPQNLYCYDDVHMHPGPQTPLTQPADNATSTSS